MLFCSFEANLSEKVTCYFYIWIIGAGYFVPLKQAFLMKLEACSYLLNLQ